MREKTSFQLLQQLKALRDARAGAPISSHRGTLVGSLAVVVKRGFRLTSQAFINEMLDQQTRFNENLIQWGRLVTREVETLARSVAELSTSSEVHLIRLEAQVDRLEREFARNRPSHSTATPHAKP